mmetsp:Transcript_114359/g.209382  ORF Transcript_114359/g.209382 Transcript_114359/m.209382 type:complete len:88 (+) Transcript_114359:1344-1607(+)
MLWIGSLIPFELCIGALIEHVFIGIVSMFLNYVLDHSTRWALFEPSQSSLDPSASKVKSFLVVHSEGAQDVADRVIRWIPFEPCVGT